MQMESMGMGKDKPTLDSHLGVFVFDIWIGNAECRLGLPDMEAHRKTRSPLLHSHLLVG